MCVPLNCLRVYRRSVISDKPYEFINYEPHMFVIFSKIISRQSKVGYFCYTVYL